MVRVCGVAKRYWLFSVINRLDVEEGESCRENELKLYLFEIYTGWSKSYSLLEFRNDFLPVVMKGLPLMVETLT